ncbi:MAG: GNAT family N-acetyltransferase [Planctomycetota bacterium]
MSPASTPSAIRLVSPDPTQAGGGSLRISERGFDELSASQLAAWSEIRETTSGYRTPFFSNEFAASVSRSRGDVSVAVFEQDSMPVGFLPFHRIDDVGHPVGRFFNDAHNLILRDGIQVNWNQVLSALGLKRFEFHALTGATFEQYPAHACHEVIRSFRAELGQDSAAFLNQLAQDHRTIRKQGQKTRKLAREVGPVSVEFDCRCPQLLERMIEWKRQQYRRTYILDLFSPTWTTRLVKDLFDRPEGSDVRGVLSVLRAGDQVVAAHYGMVSQGLLHYWFPAYNPAFGLYSPGTALFCSLVEQSTEHGIDCIDMGYGEQPYKLKQTDTVSVVARGCMSHSRVYRHLRCIGTRVASMTKHLPGKQSLKRVWRTLRPDAGIAKLG